MNVVHLWKRFWGNWLSAIHGIKESDPADGPVILGVFLWQTCPKHDPDPGWFWCQKFRCDLMCLCGRFLVILLDLHMIYYDVMYCNYIICVMLNAALEFSRVHVYISNPSFSIQLKSITKTL